MTSDSTKSPRGPGALPFFLKAYQKSEKSDKLRFFEIYHLLGWTAQKFQRVQKLGQAAGTKSDIIHNVPEYDLKTITDLSGVMYQSLKDYNDAETSQENKIG